MANWPTAGSPPRITTAGDPGTAAFEGDVELAAADCATAAVGELDGDVASRPPVLEAAISAPAATGRILGIRNENRNQSGGRSDDNDETATTADGHRRDASGRWR